MGIPIQGQLLTSSLDQCAAQKVLRIAEKLMCMGKKPLTLGLCESRKISVMWPVCHSVTFD